MRIEFGRLRPFLTPPVIIGATAIIASAITASVFLYAKRTPLASVATVERGSITEEIRTSGTVKAAKSVDLAFQRSGRIASIRVAVGETAARGDVLMTLSSDELVAAYNEKKATLALEEAKLAQLQKGTRPEELSASRIATAQAIRNAYVVSQDAVFGKADQFFANTQSSQPTLTFLTSDQQTRQELISMRVSVGAALSAWGGKLPSPEAASSTDLVAQAESARQYLLSMSNFLDLSATALSQAVSTWDMPLTVIMSYQTSIAAAHTEVSQALASLNAIVGQLALKEAGPTPEEITAQEAAVAAATAAADAAKAQLSQAAMRAPLSGVITRQLGNLGEIVTAGETIVSLDSDAHFEAELLIPEGDIGKVSTGDVVNVDLEAYPNEVFPATVVTVSPASVMVDGVTSYPVTVQFTKDDDRLKAGLSANFSIITGSEAEALIIPGSAVVSRGKNMFVLRIAQSGAQELVPVVIGMHGGDGTVQVLSGLVEGDKVASFGGTN